MYDPQFAQMMRGRLGLGDGNQPQQGGGYGPAGPLGGVVGPRHPIPGPYGPAGPLGGVVGPRPPMGQMPTNGGIVPPWMMGHPGAYTPQESPINAPQHGPHSPPGGPVYTPPIDSGPRWPPHPPAPPQGSMQPQQHPMGSQSPLAWWKF